MSTRKTQRLSNQILEEATHWFIEFSESNVGQAAREEFINWLHTSPEHVRAYLQISAHWEDARALQASLTHGVEELIALARADANVVPFELPGAVASAASGPSLKNSARERSKSLLPALGYRRASGRIRFLRFKSAAIAASMLIAALGALSGYWYAYQRNTYSTSIGEQRTVHLADGSTVELNSQTQVRVAYRERERDVELLRGQAFFSVAKDHTRPFVVRTHDARVRAVGTQFDVYQRPNATIVTVVEGRVAVFSDRIGAAGSAEASHSHVRVAKGQSEGPVPTKDPVSNSSLRATSSTRNPTLIAPSGVAEAGVDEVLVAAGEQLAIKSTAIDKSQHPDIAAATAWTQKQIVFQSTPLTEVVEEFNRYNRRQLIITDPKIATTRISGVFSSTDPASLLRGLDALGAFTIHETPDQIQISGK